MWLSRSLSLRQRAEREGTAADMGVTTIGGASASVVTKGEQRDLEVFAPGGLVWQPRAGDTVLVVKGGTGCQEQCVVAADTAASAPKNMAAGELFLYSCGEASIYLRKDGSIVVKGNGSAEGDWDAEGDLTLTGEVELNGPVTINGPVTLNGAVRVNGSLVVNGVTCPCF